MKFFGILVFNIIAVLILSAFCFSKGGLVNNMDKMDRVVMLKYRKIKSKIELENMRSRLKQLESMQENDPRLLIQTGKKANNSIIFKIQSDYRKNIDYRSKLLQQKKFIRFRLFFIMAIILLLIFIGNIMIIFIEEKNT